MVPAVRAGLCGVGDGIDAMPGLVTVANAAGDSRAPHAAHELTASGTGRAQTGQRTPQIITRLLLPSVAEAEAAGCVGYGSVFVRRDLGLRLLTAFVLWIAGLAVRRMEISYGGET
jgi:hypothetical protein